MSPPYFNNYCFKYVKKNMILKETYRDRISNISVFGFPKRRHHILTITDTCIRETAVNIARCERVEWNTIVGSKSLLWPAKWAQMNKKSESFSASDRCFISSRHSFRKKKTISSHKRPVRTKVWSYLLSIHSFPVNFTSEFKQSNEQMSGKSTLKKANHPQIQIRTVKTILRFFSAMNRWKRPSLNIHDSFFPLQSSCSVSTT